MDFAQEILMKKQVDYMWEIIRKNGVSFIFMICFLLLLLLLLLLFDVVSFFLGSFFVIVILCFVFLVVLFFWFFTLRKVHLTLLRMGFFGVFKASLPIICHTYPTMMKLCTVIPYLKKIQKHINHVTQPVISADISIFLPKIIKFCYIKKYRCGLRFDT